MCGKFLCCKFYNHIVLYTKPKFPSFKCFSCIYLNIICTSTCISTTECTIYLYDGIAWLEIQSCKLTISLYHHISILRFTSHLYTIFVLFEFSSLKLICYNLICSVLNFWSYFFSAFRVVFV